jgi:hypothetical protein
MWYVGGVFSSSHFAYRPSPLGCQKAENSTSAAWCRGSLSRLLRLQSVFILFPFSHWSLEGFQLLTFVPGAFSCRRLDAAARYAGEAEAIFAASNLLNLPVLNVAKGMLLLANLAYSLGEVHKATSYCALVLHHCKLMKVNLTSFAQNQRVVPWFFSFCQPDVPSAHNHLPTIHYGIAPSLGNNNSHCQRD